MIKASELRREEGLAATARRRKEREIAKNLKDSGIPIECHREEYRADAGGDRGALGGNRHAVS